MSALFPENDAEKPPLLGKGSEEEGLAGSEDKEKKRLLRLSHLPRRRVVYTGLARRRFVFLFKYIFPIIAATLLLLLFFWPELNRLAQPPHLSLSKVIEMHQIVGSDLMTGAKYQGISNQGKPFILTAALVSQNGNKYLTMSGLQGFIHLNHNSRLAAEADKGRYVQNRQILFLKGNVRVKKSDGTKLHTSEARINLKTDIITGQKKVRIEGNFGNLVAQNGFLLNNHQKILIFHGPVTLLLSEGAVK